jgi:hypothetical protein
VGAPAPRVEEELDEVVGPVDLDRSLAPPDRDGPTELRRGEAVAEGKVQADADPMSVVVRFEDGPAMGQTRDYSYLDIALPRLTWTGDSDHVLAVYDRSSDQPDADGVWHYRRAASR